MVTIPALWLPIVVSAVVIFLVSSVLHMVVGHHKNDYVGMAKEDAVLDAIRTADLAPGQYRFPYAASMKEMGSEAMKAKYERGPVGLMTLFPARVPTMGASLVQWFVYALVVGVLVAYVTSRTVSAGGDYLQVFRIAGTVAFLTYAGAAPVESIWKGQRWSVTAKHVFDGLIYAVLTAGVFGWLWP